MDKSISYIGPDVHKDAACRSTMPAKISRMRRRFVSAAKNSLDRVQP